MKEAAEIKLKNLDFFFFQSLESQPLNNLIILSWHHGSRETDLYQSIFLPALVSQVSRVQLPRLRFHEYMSLDVCPECSGCCCVIPAPQLRAFCCSCGPLDTSIKPYILQYCFFLGQPSLREAISMSCITNGSTGSRKTSHSSSVSVARKETLSSAAKRYWIVTKTQIFRY